MVASGKLSAEGPLPLTQAPEKIVVTLDRSRRRRRTQVPYDPSEPRANQGLAKSTKSGMPEEVPCSNWLPFTEELSWTSRQNLFGTSPPGSILRNMLSFASPSGQVSLISQTRCRAAVAYRLRLCVRRRFEEYKQISHPTLIPATFERGAGSRSPTPGEKHRNEIFGVQDPLQMRLEPLVDGIFRAVPDSRPQQAAASVAKEYGNWATSVSLGGEVYKAYFKDSESAQEALQAISCNWIALSWSHWIFAKQERDLSSALQEYRSMIYV